MKYYTVKSENFLFQINGDREAPYVPLQRTNHLRFLIEHNSLRIAR